MIEPLLDRVVVEVLKKDEKTESGIILPETVQDTGAPQQAKVLEIGKDCETIKKDDVILFAKFSGIEIPYEGKPLIVIPEKEVLARIKNG